MKIKSQKMYTYGHIFNIIVTICSAIVLLMGVFIFIGAPYKTTLGLDESITKEMLTAEAQGRATIFTIIGGYLFLFSLISLILGGAAKKWPYPSKKANIAMAIFSALYLNIFNVIGAVYTIKAAEEDPTQRDDQAHMGMRSKRIITNTFSYILLVIISVVWILPFVFILFESFRVETTSQVGYIIPKQWGFDNFLYLFSADCNFILWYFNTFIVACVCCVVQTIMQLMMSYTLSRFRFKLRKPLMNIMLILGMFPGFLTMIVLYQVLKTIGLTGDNAVPGLILVYVASSGMGYYVIKGFLDTLPKSLDEAALVDGATRMQIFVKVILPLCKPILIYTILTAFMGPWGDFIFAACIALGSQTGMNVAAGLNSWLSAANISSNFTHFCAGGVVVAIPVMVLFLFLQKYYVEGVTGGAVKG